MPTTSRDTTSTGDALLAELRELCSDVTGDADVRARRLAVLRRFERRLATDGRASTLQFA